MDTKILGGVLLIVGTSIGGGMLALPIVTASSGFIASTLMLIAVWAVMTFSAFLILEVNLWLPPRSNLISMAEATLGKAGAITTWISYALLLYSLLAAYISGGSQLFHDFSRWLGLSSPPWLDAILFVFVFGYIVYRGIKFVDYANRGLMFAKLAALFFLILFTIPNIDQQRLVEGSPRLIVATITVMLTSFGFANIIPSLRSYFNDDVKKLRIAILIGSVIPLICYILWNFAILGALPHTGESGLQGIMQRGGSVSELTESLNDRLNNSSMTMVASFFTTICVLTAFLCVALALSDFLADGFKLEKKGKRNWIIFSMTFLPSLIIVLFYPSIFVKALSYAGIFCVVLIMLLPALMVWSGRYRKSMAKNSYQVVGGKGALLVLIMIALVIIVFGISEVV